MRQTALRQVKLILAVFAGYLVQVSIMPYLSVDGMTPNMLIAMLAIVIVGFLREFFDDYGDKLHYHVGNSIRQTEL